MPFKKIEVVETWTREPCTHPEHNPPGHIVLEPGEYEYTCPGCGHTIRITIPSIKC